MYLKASTGIKIATFLETNGGMRLWITKWTFNIGSIVYKLSITQALIKVSTWMNGCKSSCCVQLTVNQSVLME